MPTIVQFTDVSASGMAGRSPTHAIRKLCTRCGWEPPCPPPCRNEVGVIRHLHPLGNLCFREWPLLRALRVDHGLFVFDLLPLERLPGSVRVEALTILAGGGEQAPCDFGTD